MKALVLVESPNKRGKVQFILDKLHQQGHVKEKCIVLPTVGHTYDLPIKELGIDEATFELRLVQTKADVLKKIKAAAQNVDVVYIATDPDREGEAIGYNVQKFLQDSGIAAKYHRVEYTEITLAGIKKAFASPRQIDMQRVQAQQARRALDRLCGYKISPFLWKELGSYKLSAGRVQSYALDLLVANSLERRNFHPEKRWYAILELSDGHKVRSAPLKSESAANELKKHLDNLTSDWSESTEEQNPMPPFTTARLLQTAGRMWGYSSQAVMSTCQNLFAQGKITYHRTDSTALSWGAVGGMRKQLTKDGVALSAKPRSYSGMKGGKHSQGAHEAIRPTHYDVKPFIGKMKPGKGRNASPDLLYRLIYARAMATQLPPALWKKQKLTFTIKGDKEPTWVFNGKVLKKRGWYDIDWGLLGESDTRLDKSAKPKAIHVESDYSEAPPPLTEAYLIQKMEKEGVGRPSTYASIMASLQRHQYISRAGRVILPTPAGEAVCVYLRNTFPKLLDAAFTSTMETRLDGIESGQKPYYDTVRQYSRWIKRTLARQPKRRFTVSAPCPKCSLAMLEMKFPWKGGVPYLRCRACKEPFSIDFAASGSVRVFKERKYPGSCVLCHKEALKLKQSKFGFYVECGKCEAVQKGAATVTKEERIARAKERAIKEKRWAAQQAREEKALAGKAKRKVPA